MADIPTLGEPGPDDVFDLFTLHGGPCDGMALLVTMCQHHGWPILIPDGNVVGAYCYDESHADRYVWDETRPIDHEASHE